MHPQPPPWPWCGGNWHSCQQITWMSCAAGGGDAHGTQSPPKSPEMPRKSSNEGSLFGKVENIVGKGLGMAHEAYFGKGEGPKT